MLSPQTLELTVTLLAVFALSFWLSRYIRRMGLMDMPNERSAHTVPVPRGGGLAIVVAFALGLIGLLMLPDLSPAVLTVLLLGTGAVAAVGYWDDHGHVPACWRALVHGAASVLALALLGSPVFDLFGAVVGGALAMAFALLFLIWLINLYNFMDGIDGLAGAEALSVVLGAVMIRLSLGQDLGAQGWSALLLAGAVAGFLGLNWPPARLFMGDVGSGALGYLLGVMALWSQADGWLPFWSWIILLAVFWVDATVTLFRRMLAGERWYEAHSNHAYQHVARRWGHRRVTVAAMTINGIWLLPLAAVSAHHPLWGAWLCVLAAGPLLLLALGLGSGRSSQT